MTAKTHLPLALTIGDPAGIGPDVIMESWLRRKQARLPEFYVLADPDQLRARAGVLNAEIPIESCAPSDAAECFARALPVVRLAHTFSQATGSPDTANARGTIESVDRAVTDVLGGRASALVTAPIAKKPLYDAGFRHPGHTEYLAELAAGFTGRAATPVMMLAGPKLRTIPVTIHIPLSAVPGKLTTGLIVETCRIADRDLRECFGIAAPRLAVAGLNPHAGEGGALGAEDSAVILPAIEALRQLGIAAKGPLPADTMFHDRARAQYDVAICMYHDQALIPAKALGFDDSVNVTLGLPFIRTSPDHGTAFDLAGSGDAVPDSMIAAIRMAAAMVSHKTKARSA